MNALNTRKANQAFSKACAAADPAQCPVSFVLHTWNGVDCIEEMMPLGWVPLKVVQQQAVHFTVYILNGYLEAIKCSGLWQLNICTSEDLVTCQHRLTLWSHDIDLEQQYLQQYYLPVMNLTAKFSSTIPSEAAKNANTCVMKCFSSPAINVQHSHAMQLHRYKLLQTVCCLPVSRSQSRPSWDKSTSSTLQKLATAFLYISKTAGFLLTITVVCQSCLCNISLQ